MDSNIKVQKIDDLNFKSYKEQLARTLMKHGYHSEIIANNSELKQFIENYVSTNVIDSMNRDKILGITRKLANMEITLPNGEHATYPIIHAYKYHNLMNTTIFYIDENNECKAEVIELINESALLFT